MAGIKSILVIFALGVQFGFAWLLIDEVIEARRAQQPHEGEALSRMPWAWQQAVQRASTLKQQAAHMNVHLKVAVKAAIMKVAAKVVKVAVKAAAIMTRPEPAAAFAPVAPAKALQQAKPIVAATAFIAAASAPNASTAAAPAAAALVSAAKTAALPAASAAAASAAGDASSLMTIVEPAAIAVPSEAALIASASIVSTAASAAATSADAAAAGRAGPARDGVFFAMPAASTASSGSPNEKPTVGPPQRACRPPGRPRPALAGSPAAPPSVLAVANPTTTSNIEQAIFVLVVILLVFALAGFASVFWVVRHLSSNVSSCQRGVSEVRSMLRSGAGKQATKPAEERCISHSASNLKSGGADLATQPVVAHAYKPSSDCSIPAAGGDCGSAAASFAHPAIDDYNAADKACILYGAVSASETGAIDRRLASRGSCSGPPDERNDAGRAAACPRAAGSAGGTTVDSSDCTVRDSVSSSGIRANSGPLVAAADLLPASYGAGPPKGANLSNRMDGSSSAAISSHLVSSSTSANESQPAMAVEVEVEVAVGYLEGMDGGVEEQSPPLSAITPVDSPLPHLLASPSSSWSPPSPPQPPDREKVLPHGAWSRVLPIVPTALKYIAARSDLFGGGTVNDPIIPELSKLPKLTPRAGGSLPAVKLPVAVATLTTPVSSSSSSSAAAARTSGLAPLPTEARTPCGPHRAAFSRLSPFNPHKCSHEAPPSNMKLPAGGAEAAAVEAVTTVLPPASSAVVVLLAPVAEPWLHAAAPVEPSPPTHPAAQPVCGYVAEPSPPAPVAQASLAGLELETGSGLVQEYDRYNMTGPAAEGQPAAAVAAAGGFASDDNLSVRVIIRCRRQLEASRVTAAQTDYPPPAVQHQPADGRVDGAEEAPCVRSEVTAGADGGRGASGGDGSAAGASNVVMIIDGDGRDKALVRQLLLSVAQRIADQQQHPHQPTGTPEAAASEAVPSGAEELTAADGNASSPQVLPALQDFTVIDGAWAHAWRMGATRLPGGQQLSMGHAMGSFQAFGKGGVQAPAVSPAFPAAGMGALSPSAVPLMASPP